MKDKLKNLSLPLIQGGMGIGISMENLAASVASKGAIGTISAINIGYQEEDFHKDPSASNLRALEKKYKKAKELSNFKGLILVNIMQVVSDYEDLVRKANDIGVDGIVVGAGLPLNLPKLVDEDILLAPIVSSKKATRIIIRSWKKYNRLPDFLIVEGYKAGGHLGFKEEEIGSKKHSLENITRDIKLYLDEENLDIPLFLAGGMFDGYDLKWARSIGAYGIQIGTRFIATKECDASLVLKEMIIDHNKEDLTIFKSPAGLPGRAINNSLLRETRNKRRPAKNCSRCLKSCRPDKVDFCINEALVAAVKGNKEDGLFFAGENIDRIKKLSSVDEIIESIKGEWKE